jgi:hypothetical protein
LEQLGRAVATFGFLEDTLARAIFALTGTRGQQSKEECDAALNEWIEAQEKLLSDALGPLIDKYRKAATTYTGFTTENLDELISNLRKVAEIRNVLNHACWDQFPDEKGATIPRALPPQEGAFQRTGRRQVFDRRSQIYCGGRM